MKKEVVITGMGVLSPIGNTLDDYWQALCEGKSGVGILSAIQTSLPEKPYGSELADFSPKDYVKPKKNIKVMSRDIQMGFVAVALACANAGLILEGDARSADPERMGVVFGCDLIALDLLELTDAFKLGISNGKYDGSTWGTAAMTKIMPVWILTY
ncbi:MAG: beta-ketoacyl synthase N-terminal-like domain-containing protein, partial [Thermoguttaceae bacterium]|nr:beta-ketoacyl synthase N-terminal-like domain-containing protein [Thermoguttaceae bacterium]